MLLLSALFYVFEKYLARSYKLRTKSHTGICQRAVTSAQDLLPANKSQSSEGTKGVDSCGNRCLQRNASWNFLRFRARSISSN